MPATFEDQFRRDVLAGLSAPIPAIPARWLYDEAGSQLFDDITRLPSYYPTRSETALLHRIQPDVAAALPKGAALVEFGAGSATKTPIVIEAIAPAAYVPVDISGEYLSDIVAGLRERRPDLDVLPVVTDFTRPFDLPDAVRHLTKVGFFPGSTIGNFVPESAVNLLRSMRAILGVGARLLIGMDLLKPVDRLIAAYDDPEGVTTRFNLNLLHRINRELEADIPVDAFAHEARWNERLSRIEMHLVANRNVRFTVAGQPFAFAAGRTIHTENSHKYSLESARTLLLAGGWTPREEWSDADRNFLVLLAEAEEERFAP